MVGQVDLVRKHPQLMGLVDPVTQQAYVKGQHAPQGMPVSYVKGQHAPSGMPVPGQHAFLLQLTRPKNLAVPV